MNLQKEFPPHHFLRVRRGKPHPGCCPVLCETLYDDPAECIFFTDGNAQTPLILEKQEQKHSENVKQIKFIQMERYVTETSEHCLLTQGLEKKLKLF